jgi:hypothetical protein
MNMDLEEEAITILRGCSRRRPGETTEARLILTSEDPGLVRVMTIPATESSENGLTKCPKDPQEVQERC